MEGKSSLEEEKQTTDVSHGRGVVMPEPSYKQEKKKYRSNPDTYAQRRRTVTKNYTNAARKAARSAEVADDGGEAARAAQADNVSGGRTLSRQSGKVIKPDENINYKMLRMSPGGSEIMKSIRDAELKA